MPDEQNLAQTKQRKDTSGSRKRQRENGSETDEESSPGGGHCCEAAVDLLEMNAKLDKLLTLFSEMETLKTRLTNLEEEDKQLKETASFERSLI